MSHLIIMLMKPCVNTVRDVNRGVVILKHRTLSRRERLKLRMKMISENTLIMVEDNERLQSTGKYCASHCHRTPSIFQCWNRQSTWNASAFSCQTSTRPVVCKNVNEKPPDHMTRSHCNRVQFRWSWHHCCHFISFLVETNGFGIVILPWMFTGYNSHWIVFVNTGFWRWVFVSDVICGNVVCNFGRLPSSTPVYPYLSTFAHCCASQKTPYPGLCRLS